MKKTISILVCIVCMITSAISVSGNQDSKFIKSRKSQFKTLLTDQINGFVGYPAALLNGNNQSVIVSYELDENSIIHVKEILTSNIELKQYIIKHIDGKKIKGIKSNATEGVVKMHFVANKGQKYFFQY